MFEVFCITANLIECGSLPVEAEPSPLDVSKHVRWLNKTNHIWNPKPEEGFFILI
jgi:hypothetical protein